MRILISIPALGKGKGGAEKVATKVANYLVEKHCVGLVYNGKNKSVSYPVNSNVILFGSDYLAKNTQKLKKARAKLKAFEPDLIIIFYADISLLKQYMIFCDFNCALAAQECTNPGRAVRNIHSRLQELFDLKTSFFIRQILFEKLSAIRFTIPEYTESVIPRLRHKARGFYNSFENINDLKKINQMKSKKIICIGGLKDFNKNGLVAAKAFLEISHKYTEWELIFYGANQFDRELRDLKKYPGGNRIKHMGFSDDMISVYLQSEINIICSFDEGNPNVCNEALSFGLPTIGFRDCPGVRHLIVDNETGILVSRDDEISNLAAGLDKVMGNHTLRKKLSRNSKAWADGHLDDQKFYKNWENFVKFAYANSDIIKINPLSNLNANQKFLQNLAESLFGISYQALYLDDEK